MDDWGSYFSAKKAKLNEQLNPQDQRINCKQIFEGIIIYINGYTNPPEPELRAMFTNHGGQYSQYFMSSTTFVIATNLPAAKKRHMAKKTLKPEWITESIAAGAKLDFRKYFLYDSNEEKNQRTLTQVMQSTLLSLTAVQSDGSIDTSINGSDEMSVGGLTSPITPSKMDTRKQIMSPIAAGATLNNTVDDGQQSVKGSSLKSTTEDGFLDEFYHNSRLHLISTMKKHIQQLVASWRRNSNSEFALLRQYLMDASNPITRMDSLDKVDENAPPVILHIDIDCFFVAVGRLTRPHLINIPVAVTHSKGNKPGSKSEIACVSYEGRAKGIYAGMWLDEAKSLCPELQTIPYEFEEYKRVSTLFFETVASLTLEIEPISCDELYLNATKIIEDSGTTPFLLAEFLRNAVTDSSKISCSIGIGCNKLSARIATRQAKENGTGICQLCESDLKEFIVSLPAEKLPGIGYATAEKLKDHYNIETCGELQRLSLQDLKTGFGDKTGDKLFWLCRGTDNDPLRCDTVSHQAKSISAGCSFGVRFTEFSEVNTFIKQLSNEVNKRATESECYGKKITLSLWVVKKGHINEPVKPGAHGVVDIHSRTRPFHIPTRDPVVLSKMASELVRSITKTTIPPNYIRGVRISLDGLRYEDEMTSNAKKSIQYTISDSFSRQNSKGTANGSYSLLASTINSTEENGLQATTMFEDDMMDVTELESEYSRESSNHDVETRDLSSSRMNDEIKNGNAKLPFLNGVNELAAIKSILLGGINSKQTPHDEDIGVLSSYLQDLLTGNHWEAQELISYIWNLICKLQHKEDVVNLKWAATLLLVLKTSRPLIKDKCGTNLCISTSSTRDKS